MRNDSSPDPHFENSWGNPERAKAYAALEFPNTYYLAYRDLPEIIARHVKGTRGVDFGCGAGRSTRFLKSLGYDMIGIDIAEDMLAQARSHDPDGDYRLVRDGEYAMLGNGTFDIVQSIFTFDNIPGWENRAMILRALAALLSPSGSLVMLDSTTDLYVNESASFSTGVFPENSTAKTGDIVRVIMNDVEDRRPVEDIFWTEADYLRLFEQAGLDLVASYHPLGKKDEPFSWKMETEKAPWVIFVLKRGGTKQL